MLSQCGFDANIIVTGVTKVLLQRDDIERLDKLSEWSQTHR